MPPRSRSRATRPGTGGGGTAAAAVHRLLPGRLHSPLCGGVRNQTARTTAGSTSSPSVTRPPAINA